MNVGVAIAIAVGAPSLLIIALTLQRIATTLEELLIQFKARL